MVIPTDAAAETMRSYKELVDRALGQYLQQRPGLPSRLQKAMHYSLFAGGKRLRPLLTLLATDACLGPLDAALPAACAVEMVHTYSLIHDDLPAMDDDDLRRGQPTCHREFDEATAILAGDALLTCAFELLAEMRPSAVGIECVRILATAAGASGMVGGQVDDLFPDQKSDVEWLESLHSRKTGALLVASLEMGGVVAEANVEQLDALKRFGQQVGLAFQIADDLLDVEGDPDKLGKDVRKDTAAGKITYPNLLGVEESRRRALKLASEAQQALAVFGPEGSRLAALADYIVEREC